MKGVVVVILDGLRRDLVTPAHTPSLAAFRERAEDFAAHRSVFPCATRVVAGEVDMDVEDGLDPALRARGYRLLCVGHGRGRVALDA